MKILFNDLARFRERSGVGGYVEEMATLLSGDGALGFLSNTAFGRPIAAIMSRSLGRSNGSTGSLKPSLLKSMARRSGHDLLDQYFRLYGAWERPSLYHEPDLIPMVPCERTIVTAHDLSVIRFPHWHPAHRRRHYDKRLSKLAGSVNRFMADSTQTAKDLTALVNIPAEKIDLVHLAPRSSFLRLLNEANHKVSTPIPERFILYAGTIEPRKNILGILTAFRLLSPSIRNRHPLILMGGPGWNVSDLLAELSQAQSEGIHYLGYRNEIEYAQYVHRASVFVFPSHFEGFGLPPLEAMAAGTPVVASRAGSLDEILGNAAHSVDPNDPQSIAEGIARVLEDSTYANELRELGRAQASGFSWTKTLELTRQSYARSLSE